MKRAIGLATLWAAAPLLFAQPKPPHIGYIYPAGCRQGAEVEIVAGGQFLANARVARIGGGGVEAAIVGYSRPLTALEVAKLRERLEDLRKKGKDPAALREMAEIRERIARSLRKNRNPALAEIVTLRLTAPDAEPGVRELRLATPSGLSNPVPFSIGRLPEFSEPADESGEPEAMQIVVPAVVNGRIVPGPAAGPEAPGRPGRGGAFGDVDRYRFRARRGQSLVIAVSARALRPYLADAVPGWFQAIIALRDAAGREIACEDDYRFDPDPILHYEVPEDGEYAIEIRDALYRGREDFVYRIVAGELPFVTGIFPLGGRAGERTEVEVRGWNLPVARAVVDAIGKAPGIVPFAVRAGEWLSNAIPFLIDPLQGAIEREPNDSPEEAQEVELPVIVDGRAGRPGDRDVFRFVGRAGERVVAEVYARRLDSPLDSVLRLADGGGRRLAFDDDREDRAFGRITHHADASIAASLPADGTYFLELGEVQGKGGPEYAYRLRIGPPRPDFELRIVPSSIDARAGTSVPVAVHALRKDGFAGEIALSLRGGAPEGLRLDGGGIPAGREKVRVTLSIPPIRPGEIFPIGIEGRALIEGREVVRAAIPAEEMEQAFAYRHLVPCQELLVAVTEGPGIPPTARIQGPPSVKIALGSGARVPVRYRLPRNLPPNAIRFELSEPPEGVSLRETVRFAWGAELVLDCDAAKAEAGAKGNLIVEVFAERPAPPRKEGARPAARRIALGCLPAISLEIVDVPDQGRRARRVGR